MIIREEKGGDFVIKKKTEQEIYIDRLLTNKYGIQTLSRHYTVGMTNKYKMLKAVGYYSKAFNDQMLELDIQQYLQAWKVCYSEYQEIIKNHHQNNKWCKKIEKKHEPDFSQESFPIIIND